MIKNITICILLVILGTACISTNQKKGTDNQSTSEQKKEKPYKKTADIVYAEVDGLSLLLDLFIPTKGEGPFPCVIYIHGGGFSSGSKAEALTAAKALTPRGYAVAGINYRLAPEHQFPAALHDCKGAVRWIRANAAEFNLDTDNIGAWGGSAGGFLVAYLGTTGSLKEYSYEGITWNMEGSVGGNLDYSSSIQAVCDYYGPSQLYYTITQREQQDEIINNILGNDFDTLYARAYIASPITHVTADDAPFLLIHGKKDTSVPYVESVQLHEALQKVFKSSGKEATLLLFEEAGHGGSEFQSLETRAIVADFFDRNL